ncbi:MAG: helix-turn-helix domain-containing protein [Chlamydiales bacterium]|nr:helix-turn-helix domain-containing protein [Chlamydiales bacterium]
MKKPKQSDKLLLKEIVNSACDLRQKQRGLEIGQLITLIRSQLSMSQRALAKRAKVPQSTISNIESGRLQPNTATLKKILNSMECDLLISVIPREEIEITRRNQAEAKAKRSIQYLEGTMSLEAQKPDNGLLHELTKEKVKKLLDSSGPELWEDDL